ncbi:30S ribosomal protein S8 [Chitinispirillales bacterium ANBcel5]|uniref:30S ribosomal protein S8 n=1 Tax=Cellulosispirillum alkaliphilum TaxID=3039283 RepID=UPI002A537B80|nr:30S ribosomal protein S8 [Chitinispirillales bacterium ANBcel5]
MLTDQIADMFNRIRNAIQARKRTVDVPASKLKKEITRILHENHFISKYAFVDDDKQGVIKILLKYDDQMRNSIQGIKRVSTPGRKTYAGSNQVPKVKNGMGIAIVSTSKGVMTDSECRKMNVGGEVVGMVW